MPISTEIRSQLPESAIHQLDQLAALLETELADTLLGILLHGSAATAGFYVDRSDLDLLAIVVRPLVQPERDQIGAGLLAISNSPHPIEISIVSQAALDSWNHPCAHQFHFGEDHRARFSAGRTAPESATDDDLAMHLTVARTRGIDLSGTYPVARLPVVPKGDFLTAILSDLEWAKDNKELHSYSQSNACRAMAFLRDGRILSKTEGIDWCRANGIEIEEVVGSVKALIEEELRR